MSRLVILATLLSFLGCSVYGNSDSDTKPLRTVEDISLNTLDGLGSLNSLNNLVTSSLEASQEFLPLALYYKNNAENIPAAQSDQAYQPPPSYPPSSTSSAVTASEAENIRKVKRFPGKNRKHQDTSPQPDPRPVTGRFSPNSRPVPRTPNLVLEDEFNSNNNSHLELEDYFGTPEPPTAEDSKEVLVTDPPKIRIKHKSDPFIRNNPGPGPGLRTHSPNTSASQPFPRTNHKKKILKRPATKVKTNRRSGFQTGKGYKSFLTNPRPGKRPHKIRITSASRPLGDKPPPTNRDLIPEDISEASLSVVTPGIYQTTASSIIREVTLKPEVSLNDFPLSNVRNVNQFENFADKKSVAQRKAFKKKPKLDFKKFLSPGKLELDNHDKLEPELSQRKKSKEPDVVISNQDRPSSTDGGGGFLSAQKTDLLDKLRSLTGGQVVAVTLDRVGKKSHIDTKRDHDEDGPDTSEVTIKQRETKDMSSQKAGTITESIFENYPPQKEQGPLLSVGASKPSKFQYYQSDVKRVKKRQHKRQDRQLRDFVSVREERRAAARNDRSNLVNVNEPKRKVAGRRVGVVNTLDRYRFENADGSITWGYKNEDGSFKEETIGVDCITHGKYGYVDPTGESREYSYTSGIRCDPNTRKVKTVQGSSQPVGQSQGYYDYSRNKFVLPNGRRVTVRVNKNNKARGKRY